MSARDLALEILHETLLKANPYNIVIDNCSLSGNLLRVFDLNVKIEGDVYVIAFGKAACPMAKAIEDIFGDKIKSGVAVTKYGYAQRLERIMVLEAGHPIPDENSVKGAEYALEIAQSAKKGDLVIVLISGGGSALMTRPLNGITLEDVKQVTSLLLECGANIHEINAVRKHISKFKGGRLLQAIHPATAVSIILSDVVGDSIEAIASGPTAVDPTTYQDAYRILKSYGIWEKVPRNVREVIERGIRGEIPETLKSYEGYSVKNYVIGSSFVCEIAAEAARKRGLTPYIISTEIEGEASSWGIILGALVREIKLRGRPVSPPCAIIGGGEVTVKLSDRHGSGGPNQEVALAASLKISGLDDVAILSVDTDGTDGPTDAAGGIVDGKTLERLREAGIDVKEALLRHDSYHALNKVNALVKIGPTRTNVNDLYLAVIL